MAYGVVVRYLPVASVVGGLTVFLSGEDGTMQMCGDESGLGEMPASFSNSVSSGVIWAPFLTHVAIEGHAAAFKLCWCGEYTGDNRVIGEG